MDECQGKSSRVRLVGGGALSFLLFERSDGVATSLFSGDGLDALEAAGVVVVSPDNHDNVVARHGAMQVVWVDELKGTEELLPQEVLCCLKCCRTVTECRQTTS